jgi:hypothetical protein
LWSVGSCKVSAIDVKRKQLRQLNFTEDNN